MIQDALLQLSGSVNPTAGQLITATGNTLSTNVLDVGSQARDLGMGANLEVAVSILQTLTSGGSATVQFQLVSADDVALTTNLEVIVQTDAIPFASLTAGTVVPLHVDRSAPYPARRYVGLRYVIGTAALTNATGQFFATLVKDLQDVANTVYKSGFSVQ